LVENGGGGIFRVRNSLFVGNSSEQLGENNNCAQRGGTLVDLGNNIESVTNNGDTPSCNGFNTFTPANIQLAAPFPSQSPQSYTPIAPNNNGITPTLALQEMSSINGFIDAATNTVNDGDPGDFFPVFSQTPDVCQENPQNPNPTPLTPANNTNGAVVININDLPNATGSGTPANSYGFARFKIRIQ